ncbi:MAG: damage-inducible protein CinA [Porticoccaceae bacterium]|nr:damage-inducible protein CinA [Porticoccaceae bacterium]
MTTSTYALAGELGELLLARHWHVTCAESCTGGGLASAITDIPGSSAWFDMGFVAYANHAKVALLGVDGDLLQAQGAVSEAVARAMAIGAMDRAGADLAVAVSGIAGPGGGTPEKPVGTVWFAWASRAGVVSRCELLRGDRADIRSDAVGIGLRGLVEYLQSTV